MSNPMIRLSLVIDNLQNTCSVSSDAGGAVTSSQTAPPASRRDTAAECYMYQFLVEQERRLISFELECG